MKTRSQSLIGKELIVDIDFDYASQAWRRNKKSLPNGTFIYVCGKTTASGQPCQKKRKQGCQSCAMHRFLLT